MKKYTDYETALREYSEFTGETPRESDFVFMYHIYRNSWKEYNGFMEWYTYTRM